jgi:nucleoid-associated protein YgaU
MTQVAVRPRSDRLSPSRRHDLCPFLLADSAWRSASPAKEHRCLALGADVLLALDKQKRLCLTSEHRGCPAYATALGVADRADGALLPRRPYPRMAPVVVDHRRMGLSLPAAARDRPAGQIALAALMVVAFAAIALARMGGVGGGVAAVLPSPSTQASLVAAGPSPTPAPSPTPVPSAAPSPAPSPEPSPTPEPRTYKVKRGDTLSGIAARFGTTVKVLRDLNDIDNPSRIAIGARLVLPPEAP